MLDILSSSHLTWNIHILLTHTKSWQSITYLIKIRLPVCIFHLTLVCSLYRWIIEPPLEVTVPSKHTPWPDAPPELPTNENVVLGNQEHTVKHSTKTRASRSKRRSKRKHDTRTVDTQVASKHSEQIWKSLHKGRWDEYCCVNLRHHSSASKKNLNCQGLLAQKQMALPGICEKNPWTSW